MATDTSKEQRNRKKSRAADGFIMMAMAVVTLALCMGLVAQVGLSFWLAVTVSAAFYIGLLTLHALVRRHEQLDELRAEVDRLTGEVARMNQISGPFGRAPQPMPPAPAPGRAPQAVQLPAGPAVLPSAAPFADPLARVAAAMPPMAKESGEADRRKAAEESLPHPSESRPVVAQGSDEFEGESAAGAASEPREPAAPQMQKIVRAPLTPGLTPGMRPQTAEDLGPELELPMGSSTAQAPEPGSRASAASTGRINRTRRNMAAEAPLAGDRKDLPPPLSMRTAAPGEPDRKPVDAVAERMSGETSKISAPAGAPVGDDAPAMPSEPTATTAWSYRPGDDARKQGFSPSESDVEMIQGLIKRLADEVNSADAQKLAPARTREVLDDEALDRSVGALRQAARNMQEPLTNARGSRATRHAAMPDTASAMASDMAGDKEAGATTQRRMSAAASAPTTRPPAPATPAPPELDVEALMRRAQPIATMTSMPPPLPAAPNVMDKRAAPGQQGEDAPQAAPSQAAGPEESADDIWTAVADEAPVGEPANHEAIGERVARIADALEAGRVDVFLEPILDLEKQQARHFEVSVRLRDESGAEISPDDLVETERPSGVLPLLDCVRLQRTAHVARRLEERNKKGNVFSTFSGHSLTEDDFLSTFAEAYEAHLQLAGQLVLTFSQADARRFRTPHWTMIHEMRDLGFGFALRAVTDLDMDFEILAKAGFKFVKLDADVFLSGLPAPGALVPAADLCKHLEHLGLKPVVEAIDDNAKREQVFAYGVRLGQGRLFGGARQIKTPAASGTHPAAA